MCGLGFFALYLLFKNLSYWNATAENKSWKKGFKLQISFIPFENNCAIEESAYIQVVSGVTLEDKGFSGSTALALCALIRSTTDNFMFVFIIQVWPIQQSSNA